MIDFDRIKTAVKELDDDTVVKLLKQVMEEGGQDAGKAMEACQEGMNLVGDLFESGEYFVSDLIFAGDLMMQAMEIIKPALAATKGESAGKMILCTVQDDLHDIGKNIVKTMLEASGFDVVDLGIDTAPELIVKTAKENGIKIVGLSGVLTLAIDSMKRTVQAFKDAGFRNNVKIIVGGAPLTSEYCKVIGADAWSINAAETVNICRGWVS